MPWGYFTLALVFTYVVQTAALARFAPQWLDLLLVFGLVCGLVAPLHEARLAGWIVGFAQDIRAEAPSPIGLHALALGLAVLALTHLREMVNREVWWVRWVIAFVAALPAELLVLWHARVFQHANLSWWQIIGAAVLTAAVAGWLAAVVVGLPSVLGRRRRHSASRW